MMGNAKIIVGKFWSIYRYILMESFMERILLHVETTLEELTAGEVSAGSSTTNV